MSPRFGKLALAPWMAFLRAQSSMSRLAGCDTIFLEESACPTSDTTLHVAATLPIEKTVAAGSCALLGP